MIFACLRVSASREDTSLGNGCRPDTVEELSGGVLTKTLQPPIGSEAEQMGYWDTLGLTDVTLFW